MSTQYFDKTYGGNIAENYQRFFVPTIGAPFTKDIIGRAALRLGERVLDVACGTGAVAWLASQQVGNSGLVTGIDVNSGMLSVARSVTSPETSIEWHEGSAESMPLRDEAFDVVLCQLGLQFMADKPAALQEMRRVLVPGGRLILNLPGPVGRIFVIIADAMERHISPEAAGFVRHVFSLNDISELRRLTEDAGFRDITVDTDTLILRLPSPKEFLWQYVHSVPLAGVVAQAGEKASASLEQDVVAECQDYLEDGEMIFEQAFVVVAGRK